MEHTEGPLACLLFGVFLRVNLAVPLRNKIRSVETHQLHRRYFFKFLLPAFPWFFFPPQPAGFRQQLPWLAWITMTAPTSLLSPPNASRTQLLNQSSQSISLRRHPLCAKNCSDSSQPRACKLSSYSPTSHKMGQGVPTTKIKWYYLFSNCKKKEK